MLASLTSLNGILNFFVSIWYKFKIWFDMFFLVVVFIIIFTGLLFEPEVLIETLDVIFDLLNQASKIPLVQEDADIGSKNQSQLNTDENVKDPLKPSTRLNMDENVDKSSTISDHINTVENVEGPSTSSSDTDENVEGPLTSSSPSSSVNSYPSTEEDALDSNPDLTSEYVSFLLEFYTYDRSEIVPLASDYYDSDTDYSGVELDFAFYNLPVQTSPSPEVIEAAAEQAYNNNPSQAEVEPANNNNPEEIEAAVEQANNSNKGSKANSNADSKNTK